LITGIAVTRDSSADATSILRKTLGISTAVITLGAEGAVACNGGSPDWHPGHVVQCIDSVGAGDAFCGGLAASLARGSDLSDAVRYANAAGALATTKAGAEPSMPTRSAI